MRCLLIFVVFAWAGVLAESRAETVNLRDGSTLTGDILRFDDSGLMLRLPDNSYTNVMWSQFTQDSLKQLSQNQKIAEIVTPFIETDDTARAPKAPVIVKAVERLVRPAHPSLIVGMLTSPVGLFILLVLYAANLVAAYEISLFKLRKPAEVVGLSAVLPLIGPIIFLVRGDRPPEDSGTEASEAVMAPSGSLDNPLVEIPVAEVTHKVEEKKAEPQVFPRGKFTMNKRFIETKFAGFIGEPQGEGLLFSMQLKTAKGEQAVERILQVNALDLLVQTAQQTQVTVLLADIQEVKLSPKPV